MFPTIIQCDLENSAQLGYTIHTYIYLYIYYVYVYTVYKCAQNFANVITNSFTMNCNNVADINGKNHNIKLN